jgi:ABC-type nickel/cobalt efflux system permease component RcnA
MKRIGLVLVLGLLLAPFALIAGKPRQADAHPLGNFTINRYSRIELSSSGVSLRYVVDYAEVPAFQEIRDFDRDGDGLFNEAESAAYLAASVPRLTKNLSLTINGTKSALQSTASSVSLPDGQGGLKTLRLVIDYAAPLPSGWQQGVSAAYEDHNFDGRQGWQELVIRPGQGIDLTASNAATEDLSAELTRYPETQLKSPPQMSKASFNFQPGSGVTTAAPVTSLGGRVTPKYLNGFAKLIEEQKLTPAFVALSLLAAMAWGAAHALGPGHGKTIVAAYLVGSRGTARHALLLGAVVTFAHVSSVITLGLVTLYASHFVSTEYLYLWLSVASGLLVVAMGAGLLFNRLCVFRRTTIVELHSHGGEAHSHEQGSGDHCHTHGERLPYVVYAPGRAPAHNHGPSGHSHEVTAPGLKGLVLLGVSGGILPCPTALVVMLGAIALDRVEYGLVLIVALASVSPSS